MKVVQKKVCMLGDFAVGKTSLVRRFIEGRFDDRYLSSVGVKISRKSLPRADYTLSLILWDLAGSEAFLRLQPSYLQGAAGALIVCDLTREETLARLEHYLQQARSASPDIVPVFVGNKVDLHEERAITNGALQVACTGLGGPCLLTSAKTGYQVEDMFLLLADLLETQG